MPQPFLTCREEVRRPDIDEVAFEEFAEAAIEDERVVRGLSAAGRRNLAKALWLCGEELRRSMARSSFGAS